MANSADPDQLAEASWSGSALFAKAGSAGQKLKATSIKQSSLLRGHIF